MKDFVRILLCLALSAFAVARAVEPPKTTSPPAENQSTGKKADAKTLLHDARKATAAIIKDARADKDLDPKKPRNKPFWKTVQLVAKNLKTAESGLTAKKDDFCKGINDARRAEEEMRVNWQLTDSKNTKVIENGKILGRALAILRTNFSKEAQRKKNAGELTDLEKKEFAKIKADQKQLLSKLKEVKKEAKSDKALEHGLSEIQKQATDIIKEPDTLDAYLATLYLLDAQIGLVRGYQYYVDKELREEWFVLLQLEANYESSYTAWESSVTYDWAVVNTSVDIPEGENVDVRDAISDQEISSQNAFVENASFEMSEAEQDEVAAAADTDQELASANDDKWEEASADEGADMSDDENNETPSDDDDGGD